MSRSVSYGRSEMAEKQLILVVEGTAAMGPYWKTIVSDYIDKIVRYFVSSVNFTYMMFLLLMLTDVVNERVLASRSCVIFLYMFAWIEVLDYFCLPAPITC